MEKETQSAAVTDETVMSSIYVIRGQKVMIDYDLAILYGVETKALKQAVRRNLKRFPTDFMFELTKDEFANLRSQIVTSSWGGRRYMPLAFTEQGVTMLSCILNSERAIKVNIQIIRVFTRMREMWVSNQEILLKLEQLDRRVTGHDAEIEEIFRYLKELLNPARPARQMIGFKA
ncbi:ORF6N domain-containing protein [Dinghuibacter silviterrae]|uniref:ORF6N domain-containing protein n=1 Tax=Dinghuibacter silviterrae TaxID=1539049 RepID=A0A4R8DHS6_9BACT|nr:ORF6N domain-containing protein [Dinghuibacter silviterrae]TDW97018.1 ORF6N domain-containing protein [Dinghuibacter silviterrae]